jgi:hypothetical protein
MNSKDDTQQNPARLPHGTTKDQVNEMENEGQAIKPGQEPNRSPSDDHAIVKPGQKKDEKRDTTENNS